MIEKFTNWPNIQRSGAGPILQYYCYSFEFLILNLDVDTGTFEFMFNPNPIKINDQSPGIR